MSARQTPLLPCLLMALVSCAGVLTGLSPAAIAQSLAGSSFSSSRDNLLADTGSGGSSSPQYGQDNYMTNRYRQQSWSSMDHFVFEAGGGFTVPTGGARQFENTGWNIKFGGGYKFNRHLAVMLDYDYVSMGIPINIISVLNPGGNGSTHLWSFTLNPMYSYNITNRFGGYVVGGGGFFRKVANFNQPVFSWCAYYGYYGGCYPGDVNVTVAHFSNNAGGLDFGTGFTYRLSDTGRTKLFVEGRYVWVDNQASPNNTVTTGYPPANYRTEYIPITFGVRF